MIYSTCATVLTFLLCASPGVAAAAAPSDTRPGIAVLDLRALHGVTAGEADLLNEILVTEVGRSARFASVVAGSDLRALMDLEAQRVAMGCADTSCLADMAGALGVPLLAAPTVGLLGADVVFGLKVIDVESARVLVRVERLVPASGDLRAGVHQLVAAGIAAWDDHTGVAAQRLRRRLGLGITAAGLSAVAGAYFYHAATIDRHAEHPDEATRQDTVSAARVANLLSAAGGLAVTGGAWLLWRSR